MGTPSCIYPPRRIADPFRIDLFAVLLCLWGATLAFSQGVSALSTPLLRPTEVAFDAEGNLYIAETNRHRVSRVDSTGSLLTVAGTSVQGFAGDGGPATAAELDSPTGLALDGGGNLLIADTHNHRVRRVDAGTGIISTVAGGASTLLGDGGLATSARLDAPSALALDAAGNLYIADSGAHRVRKVVPATGIITTVAGSGDQGFAGDGGPANAAAIDSPSGLAVDSAGNLYLADTHNHRLRKVSAATGVISTLAGTGSAGFGGDNNSALGAALALPHGVSIDGAGNVYVADTNNHRLRRVSPDGQIVTLVGDGTQAFRGDGKPAAAASLDTPRGAAISPDGLTTLADTGNQRIRQVEADGTLITLAGRGAGLPTTLVLVAPANGVYGTGSLTATLTTPATASGTVTFFDSALPSGSGLGDVPLVGNSATFSLARLGAGVHTLSASYSGDLSHGAASSAPVTVAIAKAPSAVAVTLASSAVAVGSPVAATITVTSATSGTPSGSVALLDGGASLATLPLSAGGTAGFSSTTLAAGTNVITAAYPGDANFLPSTSAPQTVALTPGVSPDFTLQAAGPTSQTVPPGSSAGFGFAVTMQGTLASPILLTASPLPLGVSASFSPSSLPPGSGAESFTLTLQTPKTLAQRGHVADAAGMTLAVAVFLLPFLSYRQQSRRLLALCLCAAALLGATGCGANILPVGAAASGASVYPITVTATATSSTGAVLVHTAIVTLTVQ